MNKRELTLIQLEISADDIREMNDRYDSGMCDLRTASAVSIALRKRLKSELVPKVIFASNHKACRLKIGEETYSLPQSIYSWLSDSKAGSEVKPSQFTFAIPAGWIREAEPSATRSRTVPPETPPALERNIA